MNNNIKGVCLLLVSLGIWGGCGIISPKPPPPLASEAPIPKSYPLTTQEKIQAVHHWGLLAEHIAGLVKSALETKHTRPVRPIYVAPSGTTPFEKVFHALLITKLFEAGLSVSNNSKHNLLLSFDIELVKHPKRLIRVNKDIYRPLAPGLIVKSDIPVSKFQKASHRDYQVGRTTGLSNEGSDYVFTLPENEIIITTSLTHNDDYIIRNSSVYYIDDPEWWQYVQKAKVTHPPLVNYTITDK